jgi:hypothetical protein
VGSGDWPAGSFPNSFRILSKSDIPSIVRAIDARRRNDTQVRPVASTARWARSAATLDPRALPYAHRELRRPSRSVGRRRDARDAGLGCARVRRRGAPPVRRGAAAARFREIVARRLSDGESGAMGRAGGGARSRSPTTPSP